MKKRCTLSTKMIFLSGMAAYAFAILLAPATLQADEADILTVQEAEGNLYAQPVKIAPVIETLEKGAQVLVLQQKGEWYAVSLADQRLGWAHQSIFTPQETAAATSGPTSYELPATDPTGQSGVLKVASGRVRDAPSFDAPMAFGLKMGDPITVLSEQGAWYEIQSEAGQKGWIYYNLVELVASAPTPKAAAPKTEPLKSEPSDTAPKSTSPDVENTVADSGGNVFETGDTPTETDTAVPEADSTPIQIEEAAPSAENHLIVSLTVSAGRVRTEPSMDAPTAFIIPQGTEAEVTETDGSWYRILLPDGRTGWSYKKMYDIVRGKELSAPEAQKEPETAQSAAVAEIEASTSPDETPLPDPKKIEDIRFEAPPEGDESIIFDLNSFNPPKTYTVEGKNGPMVVCEFTETRLSPGITEVIPVDGKLVRRLSIRKPSRQETTVLVEALLDPQYKYSVNQMFYRKNNRYVMIFKK